MEQLSVAVGLVNAISSLKEITMQSA